MRPWLKGLLAAVIGACAHAVVVVVIDPRTFNLWDGIPNLLKFMASAALLSAGLYLQKSPLPDDENKDPK